MQVRLISLVLVIGVLALGFLAWFSTQDRSQGTPPPAAGPPGTGPSTRESPDLPDDPGIHWTTPSRWVVGERGALRLATYSIPAAQGDPTDAECAVFYFGPGQGGSVEDNLRRWAGEFEAESKPQHTTRTISGLRVSRLSVTGGYRSHGDSGGASAESEPNHALLGAIVEGPAGPVFFKLTGPAKTVATAASEFDEMLASLHVH